MGFAKKSDGQARYTVRKHDFQTLTRASLPASDSLVGVNLDADNIGHQGDFSAVSYTHLTLPTKA